MTTPNKGLIQPSTGGSVGTWGNDYNTNMNVLDASLGGMMSVTLAGAPVVLSSSQYANVFLSFEGTLSASVAVTFPSVGSFYSVRNITSNSSLYNVTLTLGGNSIGVPPGQSFTDIMTDGTNVKFRNLGHIGTYLDVSSSSVPGWITACTVPPYLYCNGATFSSATYPILRTMLGGTTLPDCRGRIKFAMDGGTGRLTSPVDGTIFLNSGGDQNNTLSNINTVIFRAAEFNSAAVSGVSGYYAAFPPGSNTRMMNVPSAMVQGITMIRAG